MNFVSLWAWMAFVPKERRGLKSNPKWTRCLILLYLNLNREPWSWVLPNGQWNRKYDSGMSLIKTAGMRWEHTLRHTNARPAHKAKRARALRVMEAPAMKNRCPCDTFRHLSQTIHSLFCHYFVSDLLNHCSDSSHRKELNYSRIRQIVARLVKRHSSPRLPRSPYIFFFSSRETRRREKLRRK